MAEIDDQRVERVAKAIAEAGGTRIGHWDSLGPTAKAHYRVDALAAIAALALANQEAAERVPADVWAEWERLRDRLQQAGNRAWTSTKRTGPELAAASTAARTALDSFVRRHIAVTEARGAVSEGEVDKPSGVYDTEDMQRAFKAGWKQRAALYATAPRPADLSTQAEGGGMGE